MVVKKVYVQHENTGVVFDTARSWVNTKEPDYPPSNVDMSGYQTLPELIERCLRLGEDPTRFNQNDYEFTDTDDVSNAYDIGDDVDLSDLDDYVPSVIGDAPDFSGAVTEPAQDANKSALDSVSDSKGGTTDAEVTPTQGA